MPARPQLDLRTLLDRLAPVAYPTLRENYRPDCCIAAAAILTRVFQVHGYRAEPIPVSLEVYNAAMVKLLDSKIKIPADRQQRSLLFDICGGAWGVGCIPASAAAALEPREDRRRPGSYAGHLLLRVENSLIDATIQQAERPDKNIRLPEMLISDQAESLARDGKLFLTSSEGCMIVYRRIQDESYRNAPDWLRRTGPYPETVRRILTQLNLVKHEDH